MATGYALSRPPPHLEGNLVFHRPAKFGIPRSKRYFFVLLETVIHRYDSKSHYYKGQRSTKEIQLEEVCGITDVLLPSKQYKNCSFSLTLNDSTEHIFSAESREAMEQWVNGLRAAKEFWTQHHTRIKFKQKLEQKPAHLNEPVTIHNGQAESDDSVSSTSSEDDKLIAQVHVTTWDGVMQKILLPLVFDAEELLWALNGKVQGTRCATCPICKLQQSSMEIWTVSNTGIGKKLDHKSDAIDVSKHGRHFYLLVHNYKLLIIHFEDVTFQVLPCLVSLRAREVPYLPIFVDKLSSLGFNNPGLFLVTESGTSFLFDPEEEPLKHLFKGRLFLKNRALAIPSPVSPTSLDIQGEQLKKKQQNRKIEKALKIAEQERCKAISFPGVLVFRYDHYSMADVQNKADAASRGERSNIAQASSNEERICGSTERNSTEEEQSSTEINVLNVNKCLVRGKETDSDLHGKGKDECIESSVAIVTKRCEERIVQENEQNLPHSPHMSNGPVRVESLKNPNLLTENESSCEQMKEGMAKESSYPHVNETLSEDNDTWEIRSEGETSLIDNKSEQSNVITEVVTISGMETRVQPNLTNNELVNHKNDASTLSIGTSKTLVANVGNGTVANEEITALTNETGGDGSIKNQCAAAGVEMPVANGGVSDIEASLQRTTSNDSDPSSSYEEAPSHPTGITKPARPLGLQSNTEIRNICKERPHFEIHQCDYEIVGSPRVLELVLKVCSGHKVNEEEVGEANIFTRICLSGWHLRCKNGTWSLVERGGRLPKFNESLSSTVNVQLTEKLEACFHKEEKLWTVVENEHVANESAVAQMQSSLNESQGDVSAENLVGVRESKPLEVLLNSGLPSPQEALRAAIQGIFEHMSKFNESPEEALDDSEHESIVESVCEPLCRALWNVLSVGLRKRMLLGKYTVWNIVENFKDVSSHVCQIVDWVNNKYACFEEPQKFQAFVCECLNMRQGTLHRWLESLLSQKERLVKYYGQDGLMFQLPREKLEELVLDLTRISSLPFELHSEKWIKKHGYDLNRLAFAFE